MFLGISYFRQPSLLWKYILYFTEIVKWSCQVWEYEPLFGKKYHLYMVVKSTKFPFWREFCEVTIWYWFCSNRQTSVVSRGSGKPLCGFGKCWEHLARVVGKSLLAEHKSYLEYNQELSLWISESTMNPQSSYFKN